MIPWFQATVFYLGPIPMQVWGLMVALGFLFGAVASAKLAKRRGLNPEHIYNAAGWIVVAALIGARLAHVVFYDPQYFILHPIEIIAFWQGGMSMFGGFAGALIAAIVYFKKKKLDFHAYADAAIFGLPLGIFIGRIGCFLIHDHPGTATHFFLGVKHPDGIVRHDLGLYESLLSGILFLIFLILAKRRAKEGTYLIVFCLYYGVMRFALDFLRVIDTRYLGLTPGQYFSLVLIAVGLWLCVRRRQQKTAS